MIHFNVQSGVLTPIISEEIDATEQEVAEKIATALNAVTKGSSNYKAVLEGLDRELSRGNYNYRDYVDDQTISEIENFYELASGVKPWDPQKQGAKQTDFDAKFYSGLVPEKVKAWNNASKEIKFGGKQIANLDITKTYPTLDDYLHSDYTFVGAPSGVPGKQKTFDAYKETLRAPTDREKQILRETLLGTSTEKPYSLADLAAQNFVDVQGERAFGALSVDVLKQTLNEYTKALKQEKTAGLLNSIGLPTTTDLKQNIKDSILGDIGAGGFLGFGNTGNVKKSLSSQLDKSFGMGSSVAYNWQKWFDETISERYKNMQEIQDPTDATKAHKIEKQFAADFVEKYLRPRFDTSKSISEFVSYMDVKEEEQNVLQTQLASSALKDFANKQAQTFINDLNNKTTTKEFDSTFYWNPELITGTDVAGKKDTYTQQKQDVQNSWDIRESDQKIQGDKTWKQLAYEYGVDLNNKDDFARLHYQVRGKDKNYDPVADTYNRQDLATFIQTDLTKALEGEKASLGNPVFRDFVSAQAKAAEIVAKLNVQEMKPELQKQLRELGISEKTDPVEQVKDALTQILSTNPASEIREEIEKLNEQQITPTQQKLGYGYIQRTTDEQVKKSTGGSALFNVFKKAGYSGTETEFYTDFFPDVSEEEKQMTGNVVAQATTKEGLGALMGFELPDFSDPFAAIGSLSAMMDDSEKVTKATEYKPKRSGYFDYFKDEEDEGAPSYFKMGSSGGLGSLFG